ncbi:A/G-specific adenine glycosylase [Sphingomonas sp. 1P06PA]|uniref:A/G-specific adenine glycosylase n=1 Tax=Sphingomonas sp. 1P06PA TaxID=554121 RepID=UPI0039A5B5F8
MFVDAARALLDWYDAHARRLPWRAPPGSAAPHPYRVWLSEVMLQQTTVAAVAPYFHAFTTRWPTVQALAAAPDADVMAAWAGLGYYARARNLLACARTVTADHGGLFPPDEAALRTLPGIGAYTGAAIAAIAFDRPATVVDGNVERVIARLFAVAEPLPAAKRRLHALTATLVPTDRPGDFAQAMMDLGATICTPRNPACAICPLRDRCAAFAAGQPDAYPVKLPKAARPERCGTAFWLQRDGQVLLVTRPANGLLGGMRGLPTGPWAPADPLIEGAPAAAAWRIAPDRVVHVFTHFRLTLAVAIGDAQPGERLPPQGLWWPRDKIADAGLPTLFAKAAAVALSAVGESQRKGMHDDLLAGS